MQVGDSDFSTNLIGKTLEDALDRVLTRPHPTTFNDIIQRSWKNPGLANFRPSIIQGLEENVKTIVDARQDLINIRNSVSFGPDKNAHIQQSGIQYRQDTSGNNVKSKLPLMQEIPTPTMNFTPTVPSYGNSVVQDTAQNIGGGNDIPQNPQIDPTRGPVPSTGSKRNGNHRPSDAKRFRPGSSNPHDPGARPGTINNTRPGNLDNNAFLYSGSRWPTFGQTLSNLWDNLVDNVEDVVLP